MAWPAVETSRTIDLKIVPAASPAPGLARLPGDWEVRDALYLGGAWTDRVIVGPNGVFTVAYDPSPGSTAVTELGLYRDGRRVTTQVKAALATAFVVRRALGDLLHEVFPYPVLAIGGDLIPGWIGRLKVTSGGQLAEAVWEHPGRPLGRSQREKILAAIDAQRR